MLLFSRIGETVDLVAEGNCFRSALICLRVLILFRHEHLAVIDYVPKTHRKSEGTMKFDLSKCINKKVTLKCTCNPKMYCNLNMHLKPKKGSLM